MSNLVPQRLDHGIRLRHINLRNDLAEIVQLVEDHILATTIGHHTDGPAGIRNESAASRRIVRVVSAVNFVFNAQARTRRV